MKFIAHRGNIYGPSLEQENNPDYILSAINSGFDVEVDVRIINDKIYLGHDEPQYEVDMSFLTSIKDFSWFHAKNKEALEFLLKNKFHTFWHQEDDYTITSNGIVWAYPNIPTSGIYVMPELYNTPINKDCVGICTDYCFIYQNFSKNNPDLQEFQVPTSLHNSLS